MLDVFQCLYSCHFWVLSLMSLSPQIFWLCLKVCNQVTTSYVLKVTCSSDLHAHQTCCDRAPHRWYQTGRPACSSHLLPELPSAPAARAAICTAVFLRVRVNPWKTGRNKEATGTERVKGIPWNDFRGSRNMFRIFRYPWKFCFPRNLPVPFSAEKCSSTEQNLCFFPIFATLNIFKFQF